MSNPHESVEQMQNAMREYVFTQRVHGLDYALPAFLTRESVTCDAYFNDAMDAMVLRLYARVYGRKSDHVVYVKQPADWWQAFRERWFPKLWLQAYPVRYHETRVCAEEFLPFVPPLKDTCIIRQVYVENDVS